MLLKPLLAALLLAVPAHAQIELQESHSTASLRGIDTAGEGIAWASGSGGTVLRTEDGGALWQTCATPKGAEKLDFRGIQAIDAKTAVILSSGKGDASRIYKTTDGCQTWKLVFKNPDPEGFFDAIRRVTAHQFYVLGDPVQDKFAVFFSADTGDTWAIADDPGLDADKGDGAFAASNSSLISIGATLYFGTGGTNNPHVYRTFANCPKDKTNVSCPVQWVKSDLPLASHNAAAGVFSLAGHMSADRANRAFTTLVAVGGTYDKPTETAGTAAFSHDGGKTWTASATPPAGYRSAVSYDRENRVWIAAGTTGADISKDEGNTWTPLKNTDPPAAWNAIALPYLVGAKGRIGKLSPGASKP
ncbi:Uncharacterized protein SAMN05421771_4090 [Granulicella pectinivorans]|jgi:photosystem II stability/assembly factor-like uncharacterized protein|uniref:Photosynthesis system II assembly factor Ycf48/Hcf136-like domain-containing protein n=1 Tax=Granulicella pectinivorans TaxID=474950 RepID=A0A1I6MZT4_9BACT|nr:glycosyl hydrolase [Granulicella pectinivorans]SFS21206.1 Uncharacterized protein SAMN05421771_4090 [Granulicella pectinivorans]